MGSTQPKKRHGGSWRTRTSTDDSSSSSSSTPTSPSPPSSSSSSLTLQFNQVPNASSGGNGNTAPHPEGTVFMVLDTSGSMVGSKIQQVIKSMKQIIAKAPPYMRFSITVFNTDVKLLVTKKKKYLDIPRLVEGIRGSLGSLTALYDAWGKALEEIPYSAKKLDLVHFLVFTDGGDNCSGKYNLQSVLDLTQEKIKGKNMKFTFIQAGEPSPASEAVEGLDKEPAFMVHNVEDSARGIEFGFQQAANAIQLQINLQLNGSNTNGIPNSTIGLEQIASSFGMLNLSVGNVGGGGGTTLSIGMQNGTNPAGSGSSSSGRMITGGTTTIGANGTTQRGQAYLARGRGRGRGRN